jgi:anti-sigma B factor antagonist
VTIVKLEGRVDSHSTILLRECIDARPASQPPNMVIDLTTVNFIDSSGLATLVFGMKHCRESGGDLRLCNPPQSIRMILELTRLDRALDIYPNTAEAIASFTTKSQTHGARQLMRV